MARESPSTVPPMLPSLQALFLRLEALLWSSILEPDTRGDRHETAIPRLHAYRSHHSRGRRDGTLSLYWYSGYTPASAGTQPSTLSSRSGTRGLVLKSLASLSYSPGALTGKYGIVSFSLEKTSSTETLKLNRNRSVFFRFLNRFSLALCFEHSPNYSGLPFLPTL